MPQNKSTSRIAAITGKLAVALAALLAPAILIAETISVTFDAALTNETGWVYSDKILSSNEGGEHPYFRTIGSYIESQQFSFNVTSITIRLSCSSTSATRHLQIGPTLDIGQQTTGVAEKDKQESQTFVFDAASNMRSFLISLKGSGTTGNWHVYSATISGVPIIDAPTNLQADDIKGARFRLSWTNPENAVSNRIEVSEIVRKEEDGTMLDEYDFMAFTNTSKNASDCYDKNSLRMNVYSSFSGTNIYAAGNSTGVVQISSSDHQGYLQYDFSELRETLDKAANVSLILSAKKHPTDASGNWGLLITVATADGAAINTTTNNLAEEFPATPFIIPLQNVTANEILVLQPSDATKKNRRILIDYLAFIRDYSPAITSTNLAKTAFVADSTTYSVRGLCPRTEYVARITAFDAEGNESSPSEPLAVTTNGEAIPFSIRIQ